MPLGRQDEELVAAPAERLVVLQDGIDRDVLGEGEEGVAVVVVVEGAAGLPEQLGLIEEVALVLGHGDAGAPCSLSRGVPQHWSRWWCVCSTHSTRSTPASASMVEDRAGAGVDQQRRRRRRRAGRRCRCRRTRTGARRSARAGSSERLRRRRIRRHGEPLRRRTTRHPPDATGRWPSATGAAAARCDREEGPARPRRRAGPRRGRSRCSRACRSRGSAWPLGVPPFSWIPERFVGIVRPGGEEVRHA